MKKYLSRYEPDVAPLAYRRTLITRFVTDRYDVVQLSDQFRSCFILHSSDIRYRSSNHTQSLPATGNKNNFSFLTINVHIHFAPFGQYCKTPYKDIVENFRKKERKNQSVITPSCGCFFNTETHSYISTTDDCSIALSKPVNLKLAICELYMQCLICCFTLKRQ